MGVVLMFISSCSLWSSLSMRSYVSGVIRLGKPLLPNDLPRRVTR
jgi:hypothetical protein